MHAVTEQLSKGLAEAHYHIRTGKQLNAIPVRFMASKTKFIPWMLSFLSMHIVVLEKDQAKPQDMHELFDTGFRLARRIHGIPLLRGLPFGYAIMPLIVGENPDSELLFYAASPPGARYALFPFPVVVDITRRQVAFFEGFRKLGGMIWPILQKVVTEHIEPLATGGQGE